jgi:uncharacterized protein (DUF362 family)
MKYPDSDRDWATIPVPKARGRKEVTVIQEALQAHVLINMPIFKQHNSTRNTGCLKNLMGMNKSRGPGGGGILVPGRI